MAFAGQLSATDRHRIFGQGDVYRVGVDEWRREKRLLRVAVLGAGGVAQAKYLPALAALATRWEPVVLAGGLTRAAEQVEKLERIWGLRVHEDLDALIAHEAPDAAIVCASDAAHRELAEAALEAGLHVLVEKPLAPTAREAEAILAAAGRSDRLLATVCNKRYSPPYRAALGWILDGELGTPHLASAKFALGYDYVDLLSGGTIHMLDLMRMFLGDVAEVRAVAAATPARARAENLAITLRFASGAVSALVTSSTALSLHPWERLEIIGDSSWLEVEDQARATLHAREREPARTWAPVVPSTLASDLEWGGYVPMLEDFLDAVRSGEGMTLAEPEDGLRAVELVAAVRASAAADGEPVRPGAG